VLVGTETLRRQVTSSASMTAGGCNRVNGGGKAYAYYVSKGGWCKQCANNSFHPASLEQFAQFALCCVMDLYPPHMSFDYREQYGSPLQLRS